MADRNEGYPFSTLVFPPIPGLVLSPGQLKQDRRLGGKWGTPEGKGKGRREKKGKHKVPPNTTLYFFPGYD